MARETLRIATRKSALALWQARYVQTQLQEAHPELDIVLHPMSTQGDKLLDAPLAKVGGKGLFVKALDDAMLRGEADLAVHSMKDVPVTLTKGLILAAICQRADASDAFVSNQCETLMDLPTGAKVGTSSLRRQYQLKKLRPDLVLENLRGNVQTRLTRLDDKDFDAIILATSGLQRLGYHNRIRQSFTIEEMIPAVGQGAIGIACREDDELIRLLHSLHDDKTHACVMAERAVNEKLNGGCQLPIAIYARPYGSTMSLLAQVSDCQAQTILTSRLAGNLSAPMALGHAVGEDLLAQGALDIINRVYDEQG